MRCAECGATMNRHAVKVVYDDPSAMVDPDLGGTLVEWHSCPRCGDTATRSAAEEV